MYKKKNRKPIYLAAAAAIILAAAVFLINLIPRIRSGRNQEPETETETETEIEIQTEQQFYDILLYKSSAGDIEFDSAWLVYETDEEANLSIEENTLVSITIIPAKNKALESADVLDYDMHTLDSVLRPVSGTGGDSGGKMRLSFVMPARDLFINFNFMDLYDLDEPETVEAAETEEETEETSPYGLTLHGLTADIITSYNGMFDERKFLQALGDSLHVDSARSAYRTVTDVYFGALSENDTEKITYHIYFNDDELWEVLAAYYFSEDSYVFTEAEVQMEAETAPLETAPAMEESTVSYNPSESAAGAETYTGNGGQSATTVTTSFDILSVSTVFLAYVKDEDAFYQAAFDYILEKGCTGSIVGTMSGYEIDPEKKTATIDIMLSTGGTIKGTYDKANNHYSFSGL